jgi:hypothetical protein
MDSISITGFAWRIVFALALVFATFNPSGFSYFHWVSGTFRRSPGPGRAQHRAAHSRFLWARCSGRSASGLGLMAAFTAALVWLFVSWGWLDVGNATTMKWVVLVSLGLILGVGMSWAIVRKELTGQASVDEIDDKH